MFGLIMSTLFHYCIVQVSVLVLYIKEVYPLYVAGNFYCKIHVEFKFLNVHFRPHTL